VPLNPATALRAALAFLLSGTAGAMVAAWIWLARRLADGRPLVPDHMGSPPSGTIRLPFAAAVVGCWVAAFVVVPNGYLLIRVRHATPPTGDATRVVKPPAPAVAAPAAPVNPPKAAAPTLSFGEQMALVSLINGGLLLALPVLYRLTNRGPWSDLGRRFNNDLGLRFENPRDKLTLGAVAFLVVTPAVMAVNLVAALIWRPSEHPLQAMLRQGLTPSGVALAYVSAVLLAPAAEELIFRGVVQALFRRLLTGEEPAVPDEDSRVEDLIDSIPGVIKPPSRGVRLAPVVLTSALFALAHFEQMPAPVAIFFLSMVLGLLFDRTGSLLPSIFLHALFNGFNTTVFVFAMVSQ